MGDLGRSNHAVLDPNGQPLVPLNPTPQTNGCSSRSHFSRFQFQWNWHPKFAAGQRSMDTFRHVPAPHLHIANQDSLHPTGSLRAGFKGRNISHPAKCPSNDRALRQNVSTATRVKSTSRRRLTHLTRSQLHESLCYRTTRYRWHQTDRSSKWLHVPRSGH